MLGILSKIFGGNKSEKDIKLITPMVGEINKHFMAYKSLTNDELRGKTGEFKTRIAEHLSTEKMPFTNR
jgi:preprotein translocase subunit SecA